VGPIKAAVKRKKLDLLLQDKVINYKIQVIESLLSINAATISSYCQKVV
jgi:hypothetical protein